MTSTHRYIAFLRAINVGGHTVKMAHLRSLFEEMDLTNVATLIASGNVFFESEIADAQHLERQIERHLKESLGYEVATFLRTPDELRAIVSYRPFPEVDTDASSASLYISFVSEPPTSEAAQKLMALRTEIDDFHIHKREIYWLCRTKLSESTVSGAVLEKTLRMPATMRNVTTVRKLAAKYSTAQ